MNKIISILILSMLSLSCFATLSTTYSPAQYNADGTTVDFTFPYAFFSTSDLQVYVVSSAGATNMLVEGSGAGKYVVYAANSDYSSGARITTGTAYASGNRIVIARSVPYGQQLDINGDFIPAEPLEQQLDKLAAQIQQVKDSIARTITAPVTDPSGLSLELPVAELRKNKLQYFDDNGSIATIDFSATGFVFGDNVTISVSTGQVISVKNNGINWLQISPSVSNRIFWAQSNIAVNAIGEAQITNGAVSFYKTSFVQDDDYQFLLGTTNTVPTSEAVREYVESKAYYYNTYSAYVITSTIPVYTNWVDIDLSSGVGPPNSMCYIKVVGTTTGTKDLVFRTKGDAFNLCTSTATITSLGSTSVAITNGAGGYITVMTDSSGVIQATSVTGGTATNVQLTVKSYLPRN